jgi:hypothetical protein
MKYHFPLFSLFLAAVLLATACVEEDPPTPEPEPGLECPFGFDVSPDGTTCDCPAPRVNIDDRECRELNPNDFYSTMEGCLNDMGMIFYIGEIRRFDTITNTEFFSIYFDIPHTQFQEPNYRPASARRYQMENGLDSIAFEVGDGEYFVPHPTPGEYDLHTRFRGRFVDDYTIAGRFDFGFAGPQYTDSVVVSCPATFQRLPE